MTMQPRHSTTSQVHSTGYSLGLDSIKDSDIQIVIRYVSQFVPYDMAEDAVGEALLLLGLREGTLSFLTMGSLIGWLRKAAKYKAWQLARKRRPISYGYIENELPLHAIAEEEDLQSAAKDVTRAILSMNELRTLVRHCQGFESSEIAEELGCAISTVTSRLSRARKRLKLFL